MWTHFWDMHSGGSLKEKFAHCYIEAPMDEAKVIFANRFGHDPENITCECCGKDYSIDEDASLVQLTGYHRNCKYANGGYVEEACGLWGSYMTLEDYIKRDDVCIIYESDISCKERV